MGQQREAGRVRRRQVPVWPLAVLVVLGFGIWGFLDLEPAGSRPDRLLDAIYRTLRLFVVDLDVPGGAPAPWQLWVAAFAAPALTLRGIARLFREQVDGVLTRYLVRPRLVVVGANERGAALVAAAGPRGRWRDAVVVLDPDPRALATVPPRVRTVRGDGASVASLRRAAVPNAAYLVVVTGDNARNSAVATAVLDLPRAPALEVYVEVQEPGLARTLEQGGRRVGVEIIPFSAAALGAAAVLDQLDAERRAAGAPPLLAAERGTGPALALFGTGDLVDAVVLELHRRRQVQLLEDPGAAGSVPRVVLFGPDADRRRRSLGTLVGTELRLLDVDAFDVDLDQVVELDLETARHLARSRPLRQVFVLTPTDLDGGGIAVTLARHLGRDAWIALVTATASSPFGDEIERQSAESAALAPVRLFRVPEHAYSLPTLRAQRIADRLGRTMWDSDRPAGDWDALPEAERDRYRARARERMDAAGAGTVPLRRSALVAPRPPEVPLLAALGFDNPTALARAGLGVDFESVAVLELAGRRLLSAGAEAAFGAWCELARLRTDPAAIAAATPDEPRGPDLRDVRDLLGLRRAALGDRDARLAPPDRAGPAMLLVGGPADGPEAVLPLLGPTLDGLPAGAAAALLPAGPLRDALGAAGVLVADGSTRRQALDRWAGVLAAGHDPADVRVVALPGAGAEDMLLARALGATLGRIELPDAPELSRLLLGGGTGVVPLPPDRMTVRAFLRPARWPDALAELREPLAAELHRRYVARQRQRKPAEDAVLQPWPVLSPWLRRSNLAVVDDIPNKLALLGLRLAGPDEPGPGLPAAELARLIAADLPRLAELEHGRFTAERLLAGWTGGVRDPARFMSPHLLPWTELDEQAKDYDREVVADLPDTLTGQGARVVPVGQPPDD